jgi:hypothetical protein
MWISAWLLQQPFPDEPPQYRRAVGVYTFLVLPIGGITLSLSAVAALFVRFEWWWTEQVLVKTLRWGAGEGLCIYGVLEAAEDWGFLARALMATLLLLSISCHWLWPVILIPLGGMYFLEVTLAQLQEHRSMEDKLLLAEEREREHGV